MRNPTPDVSSRYGAPMGRGTIAAHHRTDESLACKVSLRRIKLKSGGYDTGGAYWGAGQPLYWAGSDCGTIDLYFRAADRDAAKRYVLDRFPRVSFWR